MEVIFMFEIARETVCRKEQNVQIVKGEIIELLKRNNFSLSQTRTLFHEIVNNLEDTPLK